MSPSASAAGVAARATTSKPPPCWKASGILYGDDTLTGGRGADTFVCHGSGHVTITDFDYEAGDRILVVGLDESVIKQEGADTVIHHWVTFGQIAKDHYARFGSSPDTTTLTGVSMEDVRDFILPDGGRSGYSLRGGGGDMLYGGAGNDRFASCLGSDNVSATIRDFEGGRDIVHF